MLRELNLNEMEVVSGGYGDEGTDAPTIWGDGVGDADYTFTIGGANEIMSSLYGGGEPSEHFDATLGQYISLEGGERITVSINTHGEIEVDAGTLEIDVTGLMNLFVNYFYGEGSGLTREESSFDFDGCHENCPW